MKTDSPREKTESAITELDRPRARGIAAEAPPEVPTGWRNAWVRFWFTPTPPVGLHWMRVLAGLLFLSWLVPLAGERTALFGLHGWLDKTAHIEASRLPPGAVPVPFGWSLLYVEPSGGNETLVEAFWWGGIAVIALFTLGVATRITGVLTWLVIVSFLASPASSPDTDYLLPILAFYLMLGYLLLGFWNSRLSPVERLLGLHRGSVFALFTGRRGEAAPSYAANFAIRLLQVHFAIIVVTSGLHKLQLGDWWRGAAYWYPLHPPLEMTAAKLRAEQGAANFILFCLSLGSYVALAWQLTFPLLAFRRRLRSLLLIGGGLGCLGSIFMYGELTFGPAYAIFCLSYLSAKEWEWLTDRLVRPLFSRAGTEAAPAMARKSRVKATT
jgi:pimeloyl-ACP methyl ester carboxylesterase